MGKYLVGGYYDDRIFEGTEEIRTFGKDIGIYTLESALKLGFVDGVIEYYEEEKKDNELEWDDLTNERKIEVILEYTRDDEKAGLVEFDTLKEATNYLKDSLLELLKLEKEYEYTGQKHGSYMSPIYVYKKK